MDEATAPTAHAPKTDFCARCLQAVPYGSSRCPSCGTPIQSTRTVPLLIGTAGVLAIVFVIVVMYFTAWRSDLQSAPPVDHPDDAPPDVMVEVPPDDGKPAPPPKPEKKPPLNEK